jgi:adenylate kinase
MNAFEAAEWRPAGRPNILVTGTPGVGKTTIAAELASELGLRHIDVGRFARERDLVESYDDKLDCHVLHEDAVLDALEPIMAGGAILVDHHSSDWFPQRWFQAIVVLRTDTAVLYDRLEARGYGKVKLEHNVQAEIMQVVRDEAVESYPNVPVLECVNDNWDDKPQMLSKLKRHYNTLLTDSNPYDKVN